MTDANRVYTFTSKVGISFPRDGRERAEKIGEALKKAGMECELSQQIIDSSWYLSVDPGSYPDGLSIPQNFAHQIVNEANGHFSGSTVAALINKVARMERIAAANPTAGGGVMTRPALRP